MPHTVRIGADETGLIGGADGIGIGIGLGQHQGFTHAMAFPADDFGTHDVIVPHQGDIARGPQTHVLVDLLEIHRIDRSHHHADDLA